jgi:short subunit fatty acids transporter
MIYMLTILEIVGLGLLSIAAFAVLFMVVSGLVLGVLALLARAAD